MHQMRSPQNHLSYQHAEVLRLAISNVQSVVPDSEQQKHHKWQIKYNKTDGGYVLALYVLAYSRLEEVPYLTCFSDHDTSTYAVKESNVPSFRRTDTVILFFLSEILDSLKRVS